MNSKNLKRKSIALSKVLRHSAIERGLDIDEGGWIKLNDILKKCQEFKDTTFDDIKYIVDNNNKNRFSLILKNEYWYIRANQGHSINKVVDSLLLTEITDPNYIQVAVHSTFSKNISLIKKNG